MILISCRILPAKASNKEFLPVSSSINRDSGTHELLVVIDPIQRDVISV